jgi:hypothetical protein
MGTTKVTFTLDELSLTRLKDASARLSLPKSEIVREAIMEFHDRLGRLSERERVALLRVFDELVPRIPKRSSDETDAEIAGIRDSRRAGGRAASSKRKS